MRYIVAGMDAKVGPDKYIPVGQFIDVSDWPDHIIHVYCNQGLLIAVDDAPETRTSAPAPADQPAQSAPAPRPAPAKAAPAHKARR